jgi:rRNA processing protein Krr1/Pno1
MRPLLPVGSTDGDLVSHTYLSYSRQDSAFADVIDGDLRQAGNDVWRSTKSIDDGEDWAAAIAEAREAAGAFVVLLSTSAIASEWVRADIDHANRRDSPVLVVRIEECKVPSELAGSPLVDFAMLRAAEGIEQLRLYRPAINELLEKLDEIQPIKVALRRLVDTDDRIREDAARTLGELGDESAGTALIESLKDEDVDVRLAAAQALGKLQCVAAVRALVRRLEDDDEDPDVCANSALALGAIGDEGAIQPLIDHLEHEDRFVRGDSAAALGELKAREAVAALSKLMRNDPISDVREAATRALCAIGGKDADLALRRLSIDCEAVLRSG